MRSPSRVSAQLARMARSRPSRATILYRKLFGIGGWWPENSGKIRPGFYAEGISDSTGVRKVEYFNGWFMSYKREVFDHERFDEALSGYAYKEDIDFSYRVFKRGYTLVQTPKARCDHLKSSASRLNSHQLQRMNLANQFYLHRKLMPQTFGHRFALWWAWLGLFILNIGKAAQTRDPGLVTGMVAGAWEQVRGRGLVDPAAEGLNELSRRTHPVLGDHVRESPLAERPSVSRSFGESIRVEHDHVSGI